MGQTGRIPFGPLDNPESRLLYSPPLGVAHPPGPPDIGGHIRVIDRCPPSVVLPRSLLPLLAMIALVAVLAACGGDDKQGTQIEWIPGTPPNEAAQVAAPTPTEPTPTAEQ